MPQEIPRATSGSGRVAGRVGLVAIVIAVGLLGLGSAARALGWVSFGSASSSTAQATADDQQGKETTHVADQSENLAPASALSAPTQERELPPDPFPRKRRAPPLTGGIEWLNTSGPITIDSLRGKVVLLDFWTYCCINCMHVLPDLKKLEEKYDRQLVVIGIHSGKFDAERDSENIREAILRYEISHPVVNDANMLIWQHFGVHSWPTLWLIDPEGNAVGAISGEGVYDDLDDAIDKLVRYHRAKRTLNEEPVHFDLERDRAVDTPLRFPGKVLADETSDRLFIADSSHNRIVIATLSGTFIATAGTGQPGRADGPFDQATFFRPQGMALGGTTLYVADTENHCIRRLDLQSRTVTTVAGIGEQGSSRSHRPTPAKQAALNSPWDLSLQDGKLYIAMAGPHQIWVWDPESDTVRAYAGSGREGIEDGEAKFAALAQPSGLASDRRQLFVADSEVSGLRTVSLETGEVNTIVGEGLFEFGDEDGQGGHVRLQHPLGVAWNNGTLYVADTYNNKIKVIDPVARSSRTLLGDGEAGKSDNPPQFDEPGGLSVAGGKLYIADTNNHVIRVADLETGAVETLQFAGLMPPGPTRPESTAAFLHARPIMLDPQILPTGTQVELRIQLNLADGYELNRRAPIVYLVEVPDSTDLVTGDVLGKPHRVQNPTASFAIPLSTADREATGHLRVSLTYYQCRERDGGLCEVKSVVWDLPMEIAASAKQNYVDLVVAANSP